MLIKQFHLTNLLMNLLLVNTSSLFLLNSYAEYFIKKYTVSRDHWSSHTAPHEWAWDHPSCTALPECC